MWRFAPYLVAALLVAPSAPGAQTQSPVLTLNQDRLYLSSEFGQRVQRSLEQASTELAEENRQIETALIEEEQRLTDERPSMDPEEFRALAADFDERVTSIRRAQDTKASSIQRQADSERARFFELAFPVLFELVQETGALAILDNSAVIFSVRQIDITEVAIERINAEVGAAPLPVEPGPSPQQRPSENDSANDAQPVPDPNTATDQDQ